MSEPRQHLALVAHDGKKAELLDWARQHRAILTRHHLYATGTTGRLLGEELGLDVHAFLSGPLGGDQQIGAKLAEGGLAGLVFLWDPLSAQPHDPDVKALLRLAALYDVPVASNVATASLMIQSPLFAGAVPVEPDAPALPSSRDDVPQLGRMLTAYDIDVNARTAQNRLWTLVESSEGLPEPGTEVVLACLEAERQNAGFAVLARVHGATELEHRPGVFKVEFSWRPEHTQR